MASIKEVATAIKSKKYRSKWTQAVADDAVSLLQWASRQKYKDAGLSEKTYLNGAHDWKQWSYGGCGLVYDYDLARHYCTPSEFKRCKEGDLQPNSRETWLDVQARAYWQAYRLIIETNNRIDAMKKSKKKNTSPFGMIRN